MKTFKIAYKEVNKFSPLVVDYINNDKKLRSFVNYFPDLDSFKKQIKEKQKHQINRKKLSEVLLDQNAKLLLSELSVNNISLLESEKTFTITTGHQLCLFTGPLYFIYKIISTINLAAELKEKYSKYNFVPVFWMASEDHDVQEINHLNLFNKEIVWDHNNQTGPVGRFSLDNIGDVLSELKAALGDSQYAYKLMNIFKKSYISSNSLADATRCLVNELFGEYGLIIIDGDDKKLKKELIPIIKKDIVSQGFADLIKSCTKEISNYYKPQAYIRDINFFRISNNKRELIKSNIDSNYIDLYPESFSPNVLIRPVFQELILPNIAYIGGGSEIAYWLQVKKVFEKENIPFPLLVLRNSVLILSKKQLNKILSFGFHVNDIFQDEDVLKKEYVLSIHKKEISLSKEINDIENIYNNLSERIFDVNIKQSIEAQKHNHVKMMNQLEKKLLKIAKEKNNNNLNQISKLKKHLFPKNKLQERYDNFIPFYLQYGENFIKTLKENLRPLDPNFVVLSL